MPIDPDSVPAREVYQQMVRAIVPRPIAWVSTVSAAGHANLAPYSFFTGVTSNPPSVVFSAVNNRRGEAKDTLANIREVPQFVVNVVTHELKDAMNLTSGSFDRGDSEFERAGLTPLKSTRVRPPRVAEAAVAMECELMQIVPVGKGAGAANLIIGRIRLIHVADAVADEDGQIDPAKLDAIGRMGDDTYATTRDRFDLPRPG